jgi:hypothetical protein
MNGLSIVPPSAALLEKSARFLDRVEQVRALRAPVVPPAVASPARIRPSEDRMPGPRSASGVPEVLSPSALNTFVHDCQVKWFYRKVLQLPEVIGGTLALGRSVHEAVAENYSQKIETKRDLPAEGVVAVCHDSLIQELDEAVLQKGESAAELKSCGETLVRVYMEQAAPRIQPAAVELAVAGMVGDVPVQGYVDVLDVDGQLVDLKTASKKPSGVMPGYRVQVATYAMITPGASGRARLDTVTKTKTVVLHEQTIDVSTADRKQATRLYSIAKSAMDAGIYLPNRGSHLCSQKYCGYWERCMDEYGGEVG